jgi:transcriptional regulator
MYVPSHFAETRTDMLHQLIREYPLGVLVTLGSGGLNANHIPFEIDPEPTPFGTLRGHVARANPVWREVSTDVEALMVFQGPQAYITPSWYPTKQETGKVVPTYNYIVVHAYGPLRAVEDPAWLRDFVERLTNRYEVARAEPWKITDAPRDYIEHMLGAIVGIEIPVTRLIGKWKASQNRPPGDRDGVIRGLREIVDTDATTMAGFVKPSAPS